MPRIARIILLSVFATLSVAVLTMGVICGRHHVTYPRTQAFDIRITDMDERQYVSTPELAEWLRQRGLYALDVPIEEVRLQAIENAVRSHPMVRTAECYLTPRSEVRVTLTQRIPLLRVTTSTESYYIDTDRKPMPVRATITTPVLNITGSVGQQMACTTLADFAEWLQDHRYWRERISYLQVKNPQAVYIIQSHQAGAILLGNMDNFAHKLKKARTFYEQGGDTLGKNPYREIDVRYTGQVIGRK